MPGPVSDSSDPEFGTGANAEDVRDGIREVLELFGKRIGPELHQIVGVAQGENGEIVVGLTERQTRLVRFGLLRALESI